MDSEIDDIQVIRLCGSHIEDVGTDGVNWAIWNHPKMGNGPDIGVGLLYENNLASRKNCGCPDGRQKSTRWMGANFYLSRRFPTTSNEDILPLPFTQLNSTSYCGYERMASWYADRHSISRSVIVRKLLGTHIPRLHKKDVIV